MNTRAKVTTLPLTPTTEGDRIQVQNNSNGGKVQAVDL